ncbi:hypothetical protein GNF10_20985 [Nostoc sp. UCD121]|uniref:hypothetical protein n=1 Tax=unclassified Nostoc TaxID=2593658 RepID=UPI00162AC618|nr:MULTISPECIES: hypothetical protein [unclassified Nostoc]MBC1225302.1 hypothetical protein [Nostoc sp. UCD120]MBC1278370.1 hypothetical protein [Nostoc sp. UCD121]
MKRHFFDFGDQQWAIIGALTVLAMVLAANVGYFIVRDIVKKSDTRHEQVSRQIDQEEQNNNPDMNDRSR